MTFDMFTKKSGICFDGVRRQNNQANNQFIMKVREEDRRDKIIEDVFLRSNEENPYAKEIEANIALCKAVAEENHSKQNTERRKMVRRRANEDLRQLEYKLRAAYISKAVAAQNYEAKQLVAAEKAKTHLENQALKAARLLHHEYVKLRVTEAQEKKKALKLDLQEQMALKEAKNHKEKLAKLEDKKQMDEAVKQYKDELLENERTLSERKKIIIKEMDDFKALQTKWREDHSTVGEKEQQRYEQLVAQHEEERSNFLQERKKLKIRRALKSEEMGQENNKAAELKRKSFDFLTDLLIDERNANEDMKFARDNEKKYRERIKFRNDLIDQRKLKEKQKMDEKIEQEKLHRELMRALEEKDAIQCSRDEKKRQDIKAHRDALLHALNEKKRLRVSEMKRLLLVEKNEQADLQRKKMEIEKARGEMIREHAAALTGFLVPTVACEGSNENKKT